MTTTPPRSAAHGILAEDKTEQREQIVAMFDERFFRMWSFYLAGARAAFIHGNLCNFQIQYIRDRRALPITRDYMFEDEQRLSPSAGANVLRRAGEHWQPDCDKLGLSQGARLEG